MSKENNWQAFLDALAAGNANTARHAMQDMAQTIQHKKSTIAFLSTKVPGYIQDQVDNERARSRQEIAAYRDRLAAEAHMHPLDRPSLDHSCNPNLSVSEWMRERGD